MLGRPGFVGVDEQARVRRGCAHSFDARTVGIVAAEFQLENWQQDSGRGRACHSPRRVQTDRERRLHLIDSRNVSQFPNAFAGAFRFQIPKRAVQCISSRAGRKQLLEVVAIQIAHTSDRFNLR